MDARTDTTLTDGEYDRLLGLLRRIVNEGTLDRLVPQDEAAERLGISRQTLFDLFGKRVLTRRKIGARVFVLESELLDFMRKGTR